MNLRLLATRFVLAAILVVCATPAVAESSDNAHTFSLQLFHPVATPRDAEASAAVRLSLLYGRSHSVSTLDLNAGVAINSGDTHGLQFTGLYNQVGGRFKGIGFTGGMQHLHGNGSGLLFTLGLNRVEGSFNGFQFAGLLNHTVSGFAGGQVSGLANLNDGAGSFLQLASVANINAGYFGGLQVSAFLNATMEVATGAQVALFNFADVMHGFQLGVVNMSRNFNGLQVGVLNFSRENNGTPIGLVNLADGSRREWLFSTNSLSLANVGFRSVVNRWTSVVSVGAGDRKSDIKESYFLSWHFGYVMLEREKWDVSFDVGFVHIIPTLSTNPVENDKLHYALEARLVADRQLNDNVGLFIAAGVSTVYDNYRANASKQTDALFAGGIVLK